MTSLDPRPPGAPMPTDDRIPLTLVLVRHGETELTSRHAYSGSSVPGPGLSRQGQVEAAAAAGLIARLGELWPDLPPASRVLASPMVRTQQTGQAIAEKLGLTVRTDPAFAEASFGRWEGLTPAEISAHWPGMLGRWNTDASVQAPGGESRSEMAARVGQGMRRLLAEHPGDTVVVASHVIAIRAAVGVALRMDGWSWGRLRVSPGSITILRMLPDATELTAANLVPSVLGR